MLTLAGGACGREAMSGAPPRYPARGNRFEGRVAVITGAAGNFGSVCARMMAAEGARLALLDIDAEKLQRAVDEVKSTYEVPARGYVVDVTQEQQVEATVASIEQDYGRIDCLFNNAGYQGLFAPVDGYPFEDFERVLKVNVSGVFLVLKHVSKVMVKQKAGSIVNSASCAGLGCPTSMPAYGSSKAAVCHLTKLAAVDLAPSGVRVNSVSPAYIGPDDGYMWQRQVRLQAQSNPAGAPEFYFSNDPATVARHMVDSVPLRRLGTPEEVIHAVLFLLGDESSYITGTDLNVSGGNVLGGSRG